VSYGSFVSRKHIPRRTFLRGAGVTLSLPLLEAMVPAMTALAQTAAKPRMRLGFCFHAARRGDGELDAGC